MNIPLVDFEIVLNKAQKYCAYQERCQWDIEKKFTFWVVVTRFHTRRKLSWEVREKLSEYFPDNMLELIISGCLVSFKIGGCKNSVVIKHFFKMRYQPLPIC